ncbi:carbon-nitrogen hydrolase [Annulohypoxylon maeteangense]|uniref:carbon-nitrogen hydrolase n=1 Tax=Annulohypoxylon maeteangense TaxID=1927788 RepID=UPI002008CECD|nr:carbon-nitrogen hydrolase [Annulohypoxylon maeteangense]KAI0884344.1 carbon-nitrogen hydrolase [Annulohypoxylon maeteangense]
MKIACLQFAPQVGDVDNNLNRADAILNKANPQDLDLLVLPELAVTGYNFRSLRDISPFLEPTGAGISSVWARTTALKYNCTTIVGYPEKMDVSRQWPTSPEYYNSALMVNQDGDTIGNYRKSHLYYTDETWALEGSGFFKGRLPGIKGNVAMGICMDINPYKFEAPWHAFEFAFHVLESNANVVILSMAWLTTEDFGVYSSKSSEPDLDTLTYWLTRLEPLIRAETEEEIIVIFANRTGVEDNAVYAGTSAVIGIQDGEVNVYGVLSRGAKELLVVDTETAPYAKLVYRPEGEEKSASGTGSEFMMQPNDESSQGGPSDTSNASSTLSGKPSASTGSSNESPEPLMESGRRSAPRTRHGESPISPQYSWKRSPLGTDPNELADDLTPRSVDLDPDAEFSGLVSNFNNPPTTSEASIRRPTSTKSRNASRHRTRHSQSTSTVDQSPQSIPIGVMRQRDQEVKASPRKITPGVTPAMLSPDLEKLGADLMVFQGDLAGPRRDSLICNVDEEDYAAVLLAKRKDSARRSPTKSDPHTGRSSSRHARANDSPKYSSERSHSRSKASNESPISPLETSQGTPARPASRGRHRSGSTTMPKSLSKKTSHGRMTSNEIPPPLPSEARGLTNESNRHTRHQSEGISNTTSPSHRHRQNPVPVASKPTRYKNPEPAADRELHEASLPVKTTKHRKGDSRSALSKEAVFSQKPAESNPSTHSPRAFAEPKARAPKFVPERIPPTPKAMILPPDYDGSTNHQSMPVPPRKQQQVINVKCVDENTEVREERPRSAVW